MNFNKILQSLFGNKSTRDMKLIQPIVEKVKAEYPKMNALSNDELRAKTKEIQKYVQEYAKEEKAKIAELKAKIEDTPIDERKVSSTRSTSWSRKHSTSMRLHSTRFYLRFSLS